MNLFTPPQPPDLPHGATYQPAFITRAEEDAFVGQLDEGDWSEELKRRVQHFGYRYDYRARMVTRESYLGSLPEWLDALSKNLFETGHFNAKPDQVIANEYLPGQGISAHVDREPCFADTIVSVSLLSACEMVFRHKATGARKSIILKPCSAIILSGEARYDWTHEIPARKSDYIDGLKTFRQRRISLTFRKVLIG